MKARKMSRLAAAGVAVLGLGGWGVASIADANAADAPRTLRTCSAGDYTETFDGDNTGSFTATIHWCSGTPDSIIFKSVDCTQPSIIPRCTFRRTPDNEPDEPAAEIVSIRWPTTDVTLSVRIDNEGNAEEL